MAKIEKIDNFLIFTAFPFDALQNKIDIEINIKK